MVDILRELEKADINNTVSIHIFITQFYQKFDLRTILLVRCLNIIHTPSIFNFLIKNFIYKVCKYYFQYICERHFQKISNKSLFSGLEAITHFGRPKFFEFFLSIQKLHPTVSIYSSYLSDLFILLTYVSYLKIFILYAVLGAPNPHPTTYTHSSIPPHIPPERERERERESMLFFFEVTITARYFFQINKIGIFSCGTPAMMQAVDTACKAMNLIEDNDILFQHHYKSF